MIPHPRLRAALVGLLLLLAWGWFVHFRPDVHLANESARLYLVEALVDHGTVVLDEVEAAHDATNHDLVEYQGRRYLDKAPGLSLLGVPAYWVLTRVLGLDPHGPHLPWLWHGVLLQAVILPGLLGVWVVHRLARDLNGDADAGKVAALAFGLASPWAVYATLFFGHGPAAVLAALYLWLARDGRFALAGAAGGAMVLVDPVTAPLAVAVALYALWRHGRLSALLGIGAGALPLVTVQLAWNSALFGDPLTFAYAYKTVPWFREIHTQGVYGISWPTLPSLWGITLSASRGLFLHAPALLLGAVALTGWRAPDAAARAERRALGLVALVHLLWISGFVEWRAGEAHGPRHLMPLLPLLAVGVGAAWSRGLSRLGRGLLAAALGVGAVMAFAPVATWPWSPEPFSAPVLQLHLPLLLEGRPNLPSVGSALGLPVALQIAVPAAAWLGAAALLRPTRLPLLPALAGLLLPVGLAAAHLPPASDEALRRRAQIDCLEGRVEEGQATCETAGGYPVPGRCVCAPPAPGPE